MKKLSYLYLLLLLLLSSCEKHEFKVLEGTYWQITDYTIDGADSMATTIVASNLDGVFYFGERGGSASRPDLTVSNLGAISGYHEYSGTWWSIEDNLLDINLHDNYIPDTKLSFRPFQSRWIIKKLTKKDMQLDLTLDNRKYYLRFKPYE